MADETRRAKVIRSNKMSAFTRKRNHLQQLIDGVAPSAKLIEVYTELSEAYSSLEKAQEDLMLVVDEETLETEGVYLDNPSLVLAEMDLKVSKASDTQNQLKKDVENRQKEEQESAAREREYAVALAKFKSSILGFGKPSGQLMTLSAEKRISIGDMRLEVTKLETDLEKLVQQKLELLNLNPEADLTAESEQFNSLVSDEVERCKAIALEYMKDVPATDTPAPTVTAGGGASRGSSYSATKRETVMLPKFSGDEKTAFLQYPIWKKQWNSHISEYEIKYRATMLLNHLDSKATDQIVGFETEYDQAMEKLDHYYNDSKKIVKACLDDIRGHSTIGAFDYKALVAYKKCLENNYTRLKASKLDHEISNTAAMGVLVRKFPIQEAVKWQEYLAELDRETQTKPFPAFMDWLNKAGASWELLAASGTGVKGKGSSAQVHMSFYGDEI